MTHPLAISASRLNYDDYPAIHSAAIMTTKVKVPTQHNINSLLDTIKPLLEQEPRYATLRISHLLSLQKGSLSILVSDISFGECVRTTQSGHLSCREKRVLDSGSCAQVIPITIEGGFHPQLTWYQHFCHYEFPCKDGRNEPDIQQENKQINK